MLDADDLAYMRAVQAEARPTPAGLLRRTQTTTPTGGRTDTWSAPVPVTVRIDGKETEVPPVVSSIVGSAKAFKVTLDLVEVRSGDVIRVSATEEYTVVTDGDTDRWATAQVVWTKRTKDLPRA